MPPLKFEYDAGNIAKSILKHGITNIEAESAFADPNKLIKYNHRHSENEIRGYLLGLSYVGRILYISFVLRSGKVRIVSARVAKNTKRERKSYENR